MRKENFLAVVARTEWGAIRASRAVKAQWSKWEGLPDRKKLWEHVRNTKVVTEESFQNTCDAPAALQVNHNQLVATSDFAIHTHGSMGPSVAVAEWKDGNLTVWTPSQATHLLRQQLANMLNVAQPAVRWPDGSVKWLRVSFPASAEAKSAAKYTLEYGTRIALPPERRAEARPCAPAGVTDGGTASQLIRGVRPAFGGWERRWHWTWRSSQIRSGEPSGATHGMGLRSARY